MLSIDAVHEAALALVPGAADFGETDYVAGLDVLVKATATSPHAGPGLEAAVRGSAAAALAGRLTSQSGWNADPACLSRPLPPQVVVIGLPRSGTTALHQIMAADPAFQWFPAWLCQRPRRSPPRSEWDGDPLRQAALAEYARTGPDFIHDIQPDDPEECIRVMCQSLVSMNWVSTAAVPDYHEWFIEQDERPSYRRYADNLRLLAGDDESPWLLKNPSHTFGLAAMMETFPDAVFVHIHRDPAESIVSGCSMLARTWEREGFYNARELGQHRLHIWSLAAERMEAARATHPQRVIVDVAFRDFSRDPLSSVRRIYRELGRTLSAEALVGMQRWLDERPRGQHGVHHYAAEDFGLTDQAIRTQMAGYVERYRVLDRPQTKEGA